MDTDNEEVAMKESKRRERQSGKLTVNSLPNCDILGSLATGDIIILFLSRSKAESKH